MQKRFELTYDELFILLKEAYHNGYLAYEIVEAGLEPYDANGYARWILLRVKGDSDRRKKNDIEMKKAIQEVIDCLILENLHMPSLTRRKIEQLTKAYKNQNM